MSTVQQQVTSKYIARLAESKQVDAGKIDQLQALLASTKKPKVDDFVKIFSQPVGGDIK